MFCVSHFMFYVLLLYLSDWISMVSVCVGLWIWNVCVWYCVYGSGVLSLVSACVKPRGSLSSPRVVSVVVSSLVTSTLSSPVVVSSFFTSPSSPSPVFVFSVVPLRRFHFGISTLASAFVLQPWVLRPSFSPLLALAWTLDRRREVLSQMQVLALRGGILAVTFVRRSLVFITMME